MTKPLSPTQAQIFSAAARHPDGLAEAPKALPAAARNAVFGSLLRVRLLEEALCSDGARRELRITTAGFAAVGGSGPDEVTGSAAVDTREGGGAEKATLGTLEPQEAPASASPSPRSDSVLRAAATAVLSAWDEGRVCPVCPAPSRPCTLL
ncbi:hypothetical protein D9599_30290 [Roseomonas sp. KE2513]|uniref:hypothetical protein n=1 Tax=Roseomonas sp. KE2513 TaxID=2479202 RepID=UPI0018DF31FC|nr:hypothetical protein [Roseomonas sp. KE2513]MBI0539784.1 hypothetical protein [Roseomonas sp. KE2513]